LSPSKKVQSLILRIIHTRLAKNIPTFKQRLLVSEFSVLSGFAVSNYGMQKLTMARAGLDFDSNKCKFWHKKKGDYAKLAGVLVLRRAYRVLRKLHRFSRGE